MLFSVVSGSSSRFSPRSIIRLSPLAKIMTSCISYQTRNFERGAVKACQASSILETPSQSFLHPGNSRTHNGQSTEAVARLQKSRAFCEIPLCRDIYCVSRWLPPVSATKQKKFCEASRRLPKMDSSNHILSQWRRRRSAISMKRSSGLLSRLMRVTNI
jgi:hypothetical protein